MISSLTGFTWKQVAILKFKMAAVKVHFWRGTDPQKFCLLLIWPCTKFHAFIIERTIFPHIQPTIKRYKRLSYSIDSFSIAIMRQFKPIHCFIAMFFLNFTTMGQACMGWERADLLALVFCVSSSQCPVLVCSVWSWHFLDIVWWYSITFPFSMATLT